MTPDWIAAEFDQGGLRVWAMDAGGVLAEAQAALPDGADAPVGARLSALTAVISPWLTAGRVLPVVACGADRPGGFRAVPCLPADPGARVAVATGDARFTLSCLPGLSQARPLDLMSGDAARIGGVLALHPAFDGVICLVGAQTTRWAQISAGEVTSFQSFLTGEMVAQIGAGPSLRAALSGAALDLDSFDDALSDALSRPERLAARLHGLAAGRVLAGLSADSARARLWGLLIGAELAAARPYWLGQRIVLVGDQTAAAPYQRGLAGQGAASSLLDPVACTIAGLARAAAGLIAG